MLDFFDFLTIIILNHNQGYINKCLIIDEEPNANMIRFFGLLKDSNESL